MTKLKGTAIPGFIPVTGKDGKTRICENFKANIAKLPKNKQIAARKSAQQKVRYTKPI